MRELRTTTYDSSGYSDENMLLNFGLLSPVDLQKNLTYLWGKDSDRFPLLTMTEGNGAIKSVKPIKLNDTQYTWNVMGRFKFTSQVVGLHVSLTNPGIGYGTFGIIFKDNWFPKNYGVSSPDGLWFGRIQSEPQKLGENRYLYMVTNMSGDPDNFCAVSNFEEGKYWSMTAPTIAASKSDGNRFNAMAPGKMTNQFGYHRFSKQIAGNVASKVTEIQFELLSENGTSAGTTNMWFPFEWKQFEVARRILQEEDLYYSEYNRDEKGVIHLVDEETGEPIPRGAGVRQIVQAVGNYDTIGTDLTVGKIESVVNSIFDQRVDHEVNEIVIYTGKGGARMWHKALLKESINNGFLTPLGEHVIQGGEYLTYGKYFNQYKTYEGKLITVKHSNVFDHGIEAEKQKMNGDTYLGLPRNSYTMMFLDHSRTEEGNRNIEMVCEEGRESEVGVYKGMAKIPGAWGAFNNLISTTKDIASYENITSQGINITNPTTSFWLELEM